MEITSPNRTYRVMFSDGRVVDFLMRSDTSGHRTQMLAHAEASGSSKGVKIQEVLRLDPVDGYDGA